jgi:hypothetical protein
MSDNTKVCAHCKVKLPVSEFYMRKGGYLTAECKTCMRARSKGQKRVPKTKALIPSEALLINRLHSLGIPALPGKAISHAHVDVVAWGVVEIEVKYSTLKNGVYSFITTEPQRQHGFRAQVVVLVCDDGTSSTFHCFEADHPVFFMDGEMKHAITYAPGVKKHKHESNRVILTRELMDLAQDRWDLIEHYRLSLSEALKHT